MTLRALTLDFRRHAGPAWLGLAVLAAGLAGIALLAQQYRAQLDEQAQLEGQGRAAAALARRHAAAPRGAADPRQVALELKRAQRLLLQMSTPWNEMFASLEAANPPTVALLGIESDVERQSMKITAEAKDTRAMFGYLRELERRPEFGDVHLQSHEVQAQDTQRPVRFVLAAAWRSAQ